MARDVISVTPETRILDVHRLFVQEEIHGAPVVGDDGVVCGVLSTLDLLRIVRDELEPGATVTAASYFQDDLPSSGADWLQMGDELQDRLGALTAADAMTRDIVMIGPDATVDEVARLMLAHHVHRLLVIEDHALQGVISTFDLLRAVSRPAEPHPAVVRSTGYRRGDLQ